MLSVRHFHQFHLHTFSWWAHACTNKRSITIIGFHVANIVIFAFYLLLFTANAFAVTWTFAYCFSSSRWRKDGPICFVSFFYGAILIFECLSVTQNRIVLHIDILRGIWSFAVRAEFSFYGMKSAKTKHDTKEILRNKTKRQWKIHKQHVLHEMNMYSYFHDGKPFVRNTFMH